MPVRQCDVLRGFQMARPANKALAKIADLLHGDLTMFGVSMPQKALRDKLRAEQVSIVARYTQGMMLANIFNACALLAALWSTPVRGEATLWAFFLITFATFLYLKRRANAGRPAPTVMPERVVVLATVNAAVIGLIWAALPFFFFASAPQGAQLVILSMCVGMLFCGALSLASIPLAATAFLTPLSFSTAFAIIEMNSAYRALLACLLIAYQYVVMRGVVTYAAQTARKTIAQFESDELAITDSLTGALNRKGLRNQLAEALARLDRYGDGFAVFCLDLDGFKVVNDHHGHAAGDDLLRQVADRVRSCMRDVDLLARIGGDEFAVIGVQASKPEQAIIVAERVLKAFTAPFAIEGRQLHVGISIGVALAPSDGTDIDGLLEKADAALYNAKRGGKGTYDFFTREHDDLVRERRVLEAQLRSAIRNREMHLEFQPIVSLATGALEGFEALARWNNPGRGAVSPSVFIPLAEEIGVIQELGEWVVKEAVRVASRWPEHLSVAINASSIQFRTPRLLAVLHDALSQHNMPAGRVEIEITESTLIAESESAISLLKTLRQWGVKIALDDFGTGYSSLRYILDLPLDKIKIDKSFVQTCLDRPVSGTLIRAVVCMARDLGLIITAEGIETAAHAEFLLRQGCDQAQGFHYHRPAPADEVDILIANEAKSRQEARAA